MESRTRRKSIGIEPEFEDPYDTRWEQQFDAAPLRPYKTKDEYLYAMREDLADWLNALYNIDITSENFFEKLETGSLLCQHSNNVRRAAIEYKQTQASREDPEDGLYVGHAEIRYKPDAVAGTFLARDNISNFIHWCRHCLNIKDVLLFESDDLVLRKNTKSCILCLLEVARRGGKIGMPVPMLVQFEKEIDMELRNSMNLSGMSYVPSDKSESISTGPLSPSSSAATTDIEPESPSSEYSDSSNYLSSGRESAPYRSSSGRLSAPLHAPHSRDSRDVQPIPPIRRKDRSKSLPRSSNKSRGDLKPTPPLRRNNSLRRPRQLPVVPVRPNNGTIRGVDSLSRRMRNRMSPNRHSSPTVLDSLQAELDATLEEPMEPQAQIMLQPAILKSLDERVRDLVNRCTCPAQFPMIREAEGKYRIGEANTLIFVRILRNHVMVRVGGGWDTLEHYLDKHDPCRCQLHRKKKPHNRAHSQPVAPMSRSQSPVQRVRRISGGGNRHSLGNRSLDSSTFNEALYARPVTPEPHATSKSMVWRRTDNIETTSMDSQTSAELAKSDKNSNLDDDDLLSPASDLSVVERLIEETSRHTEKAEQESESEQPIPPKRPSQLNTNSNKTATEILLRRRRSSEVTRSRETSLVDANQTKSAPTSPKRNGAVLPSVNIVDDNESPVQSGDVWRRFAIAGARDSASPAINRRTRSISGQTRSNRERSESPLTRNRSCTPPSSKRKPRAHSKENKKDNSNNVLIITRDSEGRHRLDSNSSCDSNDSRSVDGVSSGRRTPDLTKSTPSRRGLQRNVESTSVSNRLLYGREGTRPQSSERLRSRSTEPVVLKERQRTLSAGPRQSNGSPSITRRRRTTIHDYSSEHSGNKSRSLQDKHSERYPRKLPSLPDEADTKKTPSGSVWRRTSDTIEDDFRASLEARLGTAAYPRSRSGNSSPLVRQCSRSRLRPVTPVPRHMKVDSHIVTSMRKDPDHDGRQTRIPMPVQHKRILDGSRDVRTRSLPDLLDLPRWLLQRIEMESTDEYRNDNFDCSRSQCSSMDSVSPTPSVKTDNPNDSGYEDNSAAKSSPLSTLSFPDDASPPDPGMQIPGQGTEDSGANALIAVKDIE